MKIPERFSQETIWREVIPPVELDDWVNYVHEEVYIAIRNAGYNVTNKADISICIHMSNNTKPTYSGNVVNGSITIQSLSPCGVHFYTIAKFSEGCVAEETFKEYAAYKKRHIKVDKSCTIESMSIEL